MHQQVRVSTTKSTDDAARSEEGSLEDILTILKGVNLRSAGGTNLDSGGPFVFSVRHRPNDDTADMRARDLLRAKGYGDAEVYQVRYCILDDREGALLECIQSTEAELGEAVIEVHVLTAEPNRKVPVQIVTASMLARGGESAG